MSTDLRGRAVLIIGGETTVGRALVVGLAEAGADVAIASLTLDTQAEFAINSALNELWAIGRKGLALAIDASDPAQLIDAEARAEAELGSLDAIIAVGEDIVVAELRAVFPERDVVGVAPESDPAAALAEVIVALV